MNKTQKIAQGLIICLGVLGLANHADALKFDYQIGNTNDSNQIVVSDGGYSATASGWGGIIDPQSSLDPTNPAARVPRTWVSTLELPLALVGGLGAERGSVFPNVISFLPPGKMFSYSTSAPAWKSPRIYGTLLENPDDITAWGWDGAAWELIGTDNCPPPGLFNNCGSWSQYDGEDIGQVGGGTLLPSNSTRHLMLVAENSGVSAFASFCRSHAGAPTLDSAALWAGPHRAGPHAKATPIARVTRSRNVRRLPCRRVPDPT